MTTYYVRKTGNDGAAGTSPATAWLTIGKALGAAGISSGDTVYIGAGVYRECVTVAMVSAVAETFVIGDVDGSHTGDQGPVIWTAFLTNDKTAPSSDPVVNLNQRDYLTFENFYFVAGASIFYDYADLFAQYLTVRNCVLWNPYGNETIYISNNAGSRALHWIIDRCIITSIFGSSAIYFLMFDNDTADVDIDFTAQNCMFLLGDDSKGIYFDCGLSDPPLSYLMAGGIVRGCTFFGGGKVIFVADDWSDSNKVSVTNCLMLGSSQALQGNLTVPLHNVILEDYNTVLTGDSTYANVAHGGHSKLSPTNVYSALPDLGYSQMIGLMPRHFFEPMSGSPLLGFGDDGNAPSVDILNRPRPAGGQSILKAVGAYERHDTAVKETAVFDVTPGIKIVGPGDHEFQIPVDATATTISVKARYDANHAATNKPQAILLAAPEIGISAETKTMTAAVDTWETLTFTQFMPTASGVITVRLVSRSAADNGIAYFDTFNIS